MKTLDKIIVYEQGDLTNDETIELFQELVNSGLAWQMGGYYARRAECLIKQGKIKAKTKTNEEAEYENLSGVNTGHRVLNGIKLEGTLVIPSAPESEHQR